MVSKRFEALSGSSPQVLQRRQDSILVFSSNGQAGLLQGVESVPSSQGQYVQTALVTAGVQTAAVPQAPFGVPTSVPQSISQPTITSLSSVPTRTIFAAASLSLPSQTSSSSIPASTQLTASSASISTSTNPSSDTATSSSQSSTSYTSSTSEMPFPTRTVPFSSSSPTSTSVTSGSGFQALIHSQPVYASGIALLTLIVLAFLTATTAYVFRCLRRRKLKRNRLSLEELIIEETNRDRDNNFGYDHDPEVASVSENRASHLQLQFPTDPEFGTPRAGIANPRFLGLGDGLEVPWEPRSSDGPTGSLNASEAHIATSTEKGDLSLPRALPLAPPPATLPRRGTLSRASSDSSQSSGYVPSSNPFRDPSSSGYPYAYSVKSLPSPSAASSQKSSAKGMWAFGFGSALSLASTSVIPAADPLASSNNVIPSSIPSRAAEPLDDSNKGWSASLKAGFFNAFSALRGGGDSVSGAQQMMEEGQSDTYTKIVSRKTSRKSTRTSWAISQPPCDDDEVKPRKEGEAVEYWGGELVGLPSQTEKTASPAPLDMGFLEVGDLGMGLGLDPHSIHGYSESPVDMDGRWTASPISLASATPLIIKKKSLGREGVEKSLGEMSRQSSQATCRGGGGQGVSRKGTMRSMVSSSSTRRSRVSRANSIMTVLDEKEEEAGRALRERWARNLKQSSKDD
ncbi:hypothetical protein D9758_010188 [Tetrapyrgos nigripes]|uniref:Uncharacterized protein n=1 Tax=Tetrapyrgos nigripes TaxID=182062 RepID=A0A8H5CXL3_9AGAR|nr:hypothetical protein D9758_010188 [Tetrapyrgos nigripes]